MHAYIRTSHSLAIPYLGVRRPRHPPPLLPPAAILSATAARGSSSGSRRPSILDPP